MGDQRERLQHGYRQKGKDGKNNREMFEKKVSVAVKGQLYKTMVRPAMLYGIKTLAVTIAQKRKMQVAEMKMLRWSLGIK